MPMKNNIINHDKYAKALKSLAALSTANLPQFMVFLIGVSRVGKSTILLDLLNHLPKEFQNKVIRFEAPPKMTSQFTFKPFLLRYLEHLGDPFSKYKPTSYKRKTNDELISLITRRIKQQGIRLIIIDEADLFVTVRGESQAYENLLFLKSLVNITGVTHVFAGTPPLAEFLSMEGQVINRSHVIRLHPYDISNTTHTKIFCQILREFESSLEIPLSAELKQNPSLLFAQTNGCVGALKELLTRLQALASMHKQKEISRKFLELFGYYDPDSLREEEIADFLHPQEKAKDNPAPPKWHSRRSDPSHKGRKLRPGKRKNPIDNVGDQIGSNYLVA